MDPLPLWREASLVHMSSEGLWSEGGNPLWRINLYPFPLKPKHMHSTTYDRLRLQADQALKDVLAEMRSLSSAK